MKCGSGDRRASSNAPAARFVVVWDRGRIRYAPVEVRDLQVRFECKCGVYTVLNSLKQLHYAIK